MKWIRWTIFMILLTIGVVVNQWPDEKLRVVFCDVGEGDATIIIKGSFQAVIDTGPGITQFDKCFSSHVPFWDRKIEVLYISHQHKDHSGALADIKKRFQVGTDMSKTNSDDVVRYGNIYIDTLLGNEPDTSNVLGATTENDNSVILEVKYNKFSILFTSDIDEKGELALIDSGVLEQVKVLKVAHHGSKYGSSQIFLEKTMPEVAVISVGAKNTYGHPNGDTLMRLDMIGSKVFRTDKMGSIEITTDGDKYEVTHK